MPTRSRRGLATWLTTSSSPLFVLDARRVVLVFNRGCEMLTQWSSEEILGKTCHSQTIADPAHPGSITGLLSPPNNGTTSGVSRVVLHRPDGSLLVQEIHFFPLLSEDPEEPPHLLGLFLEPASTSESSPGRRYDLARHTADLHQKYRLDRIIANSAPMQRVAAQIELARRSSTNAHIVGARGTGKEHVARLIHYGSPNRLERFIPIRCGESSIHEIERTLNRLYDPDGGQTPATIYLDQVPKLSLSLQRLVLEQLDRGRFRHISSSPDGIDIVNDDSLLPELRWKLAPLTIHLPRLAERENDLLLLAQQILEEQNQTSDAQRQGFTPAVERLFQQYNWPGNTEELSRIIMHAAQRSPEGLIDLPHLPPEFAAGFSAQATRPRPVRLSLEEELDTFERTRIEQALAESRGNKSVAADLLKMPRAKLYRRLAHFGLITEEDSQASPPES